MSGTFNINKIKAGFKETKTISIWTGFWTYPDHFDSWLGNLGSFCQFLVGGNHTHLLWVTRFVYSTISNPLVEVNQAVKAWSICFNVTEI